MKENEELRVTPHRLVRLPWGLWVNPYHVLSIYTVNRDKVVVETTTEKHTVVGAVTADECARIINGPELSPDEEEKLWTHRLTTKPDPRGGWVAMIDVGIPSALAATGKTLEEAVSRVLELAKEWPLVPRK